MSSVKLRFGILGAAGVFEKRMWPAFQKSQDAELYALATQSSAKREKFKSLLNCKITSNYEDLLNDPAVQAVYIPLPNALHEEWCLKALNKGKHVLCEKSLALNHTSAQRIVQAARQNNCLVSENFMCEYHLQHAYVQKWICSQAAGKPLRFLSHFRIPHLPADNIRYSKKLGGGALNDLGAYGIFMGRFLFQEEPISITGTLENRDFDVDVQGQLQMHFNQHHVTAELNFGFGFDYENHYEVICERGSIKVNMAYSINPDATPQVSVQIMPTTSQTQQKSQSTNVDLAPDDQFLNILKIFSHNTKNVSNYDLSAQKVLNQAKAMDLARQCLPRIGEG